MNIINSLDITAPETLIKRLQQTREAVKENLNDFTDDWKQTATQGTQNAMDAVTNTVEQAKSLQPFSVQSVVTSSVANWYEQHPAFLKAIALFNWSISHPIISLILILFSLAIFWSLIKAIGRLIESASLSILQIPLKLFQILIKYSWRSLSKFGNFITSNNTNTTILKNPDEHQIQNITAYQIVSCSKQQRLKDISARLEEIQQEQQELLQEAADILDSERINSSVN